MSTQFAQMSFVDNKLLLNGEIITEGQLLEARHGNGSSLIGRVRYNDRWYLDFEEFVGHSYLNVPLDAEDLTVAKLMPYVNKYATTLEDVFGI